MVAGAGLRDREIIAAQVAALRDDAAGPAREFERGALAALCWLLEGGSGPITDKLCGRPGTPRAIVQELAAAEALIYGATTDRADLGPVRHVFHPCQDRRRRTIRRERTWRPVGTAGTDVWSEESTMGLLDELMGGGEQQQSFREFADRYSEGARTTGSATTRP
jgi:hypothetical protein